MRSPEYSPIKMSENRLHISLGRLFKQDVEEERELKGHIGRYGVGIVALTLNLEDFYGYQLVLDRNSGGYREMDGRDSPYHGQRC